jgi:hypothetical protein
MKKTSHYVDNTPGIVNAYYEANDGFLRFLTFCGKGLIFFLAITTALGIFANAFADHSPKKAAAQSQPTKQNVKPNKPAKKTIQQKTNETGVSP